jgi:hypothetical protein
MAATNLATALATYRASAFQRGVLDIIDSVARQ